eukprot:GFYU01023194.1.p1 GENE.GFYU01023194.1~~GFYU01023194.1.p1  ORF type:complete len:302 (-),score=57.14 GFYU01023194.1:142-1047(-)
MSDISARSGSRGTAALNDPIVVPTGFIGKVERYLRWDEISVKDLIQPNFISLKKLVFMRLVWFLMTFPVAMYVIISGWDTNASKKIWPLCYMTIQSFTFIGLYFGLSIVNVYRERITFKKLQDYGYELIEYRSLTFLHKLQWVTFEVLVTAAPVVTVVYWTILFPKSDRGGGGGSWTNIFVHALNSVFMLSEFSFSRMKIIPSHWIFIALFSGTYVTFALIWHEATGAWIYFFLDYNKPVWPAFYFGILFFVVGLFFVLVKLGAIRDRAGRPRTTLPSTIQDYVILEAEQRQKAHWKTITS